MINLKSIGIGFWAMILFLACSHPAKKEQIMVSIEPQRYFAEKILGDRYQISCLVPEGQSPESYQPSPKQMIEVGRSVAYFQIGQIGFEQAWMVSIKANNPAMKFYDLSRGFMLIEAPREEDEGKSPSHHGHHHHGGMDPHIWSSISGAKAISANILNAARELDPENKSYYEANYQALMREIEQTGDTIRQLLSGLEGSAFIIYHPALTYFAQENGLLQLCIEMDGKEPSSAQLEALVETAKRYQAKTIFVQREFDQKNAEIIAQETGCDLRIINPLAYQWDQELIHIAKVLAHGQNND